MPTEGELDAFYGSHAYREEHGPVPITERRPDGYVREYLPSEPDYEDGLRVMADWRVRWTSEWAGLVRGMRLLEIGSGDGHTLAAYARAGLECVGIEPDREEARRSAERLPDTARVHAARWQDVGLEDPFDAVVSFHVLEHLHEPVAALKAWRQLLRPRGALLIEVPNVLQPSSPVDTNHFQWVHLYDFSPHTLAACLVTAGYEVAQMSWRTGNLCCMARPAAQPETYEIPHGGDYVRGYLDAVRGFERHA